ncbi:MAG TPA: hypothetical protein VD866_07615 [Urbifossiella sp.]|nr:hypothetical protein [Urbifossiella sp.]
MAHVRVTLAALAAVVAAVGGSAVVSGQQPGGKGPNLPQRTGAYLDVAGLRSAGGVTKADAAKAKAAFEAFAKYHADYVSLPLTHTAPQDFRVEPPPTNPNTPLTVDQLITEIYRNLIVPSPVPVQNPVAAPGQGNIATATARDAEMIAKESEYIRGLGTALDKALGEIVTKSNDQVVKINAARMLAAACRSGARDHWPTVTKLLTDPNVPPEIRYYALHAAGNLFAAYDINDYRSRKHAADPKTVGALITAVQNCVLKADALVTLLNVPDEKGVVRKVVPPDQVAVLQYIRRQAVRSLGQVRFAEYETEPGKKLYPVHTLALVALNKVPIDSFQISGQKIEFGPAPKNAVGDSADAGEAVLGILNMAPPRGGAAAKQYAAPMADVIATGVITWVGPRSANPASKDQPWKGMALRLDEGLKTWQGLFDVNWDPVKPVIQQGLVPQSAKDVAKAVTEYVIEPLGSTTRPVNLTGLQTTQRDVLRRAPDITPRPFVAPDSPALPVQFK